MLKFDSVREALAIMHTEGVEIMRGICQNGLYLEDKSFQNNDI